MNKRILIALLALSAPVRAATLNFVWNANPEPDVIGYRLYQRTGTTPAPVSAPVYKLIGEVKEPKIQVKNVTAGSLAYTVTAFNASGMESDPCPELPVSIPSIPAGLKVTVTITLNAAP